jgi:hypothetical protein
MAVVDRIHLEHLEVRRLLGWATPSVSWRGWKFPSSTASWQY